MTAHINLTASAFELRKPRLSRIFHTNSSDEAMTFLDKPTVGRCADSVVTMQMEFAAQDLIFFAYICIKCFSFLKLDV